MNQCPGCGDHWQFDYATGRLSDGSSLRNPPALNDKNQILVDMLMFRVVHGGSKVHLLSVLL